MRKRRIISLLMLVAFAANFTVFCHCAAALQKHSCCCEKTQKKSAPCHSAEAVKFNLVEKQLADQIQAAPLPVIAVTIQHPLIEPAVLPAPVAPQSVSHPPPDLLTLQQRLLI